MVAVLYWVLGIQPAANAFCFWDCRIFCFTSSPFQIISSSQFSWVTIRKVSGFTFIFSSSFLSVSISSFCCRICTNSITYKSRYIQNNMSPILENICIKILSSPVSSWIHSQSFPLIRRLPEDRTNTGQGRIATVLSSHPHSLPYPWRRFQILIYALAALEVPPTASSIQKWWITITNISLV